MHWSTLTVFKDNVWLSLAVFKTDNIMVESPLDASFNIST